jgi:hypothetical protein
MGAIKVAHLEHIALLDLIALLVALQHFLENPCLLLNPTDFLSSLGPPIRLVPRVVTCHDFHELVRFLQVLGPTPTNQLLQFCRLCFSFLFLHFFC